MAVGSGIAASFGSAVETTFGTYVAPTRWYQVNQAQLRKVKNTQQGGGLAAGRLVDLASRRVVTTVAGAGTFQLPIENKGMGVLLAHLMGSSTSPVQQGATAAYLQTHALGDNVGKYLTLQAGVPDLGGTVRPYSFLGSKILGATFESEIDGLLMATFDIDSRDVTEAQALAAPSYSTGLLPRKGTELAVKVGATVGAAASVSGVKKVAVSIQRGQQTGRFYAGASGLKGEPIMNDKVQISGTITADLTDKTIWADRFAADTQFALVLEWVGPLIASTFFETFRITLPACFLDGNTPTIDGPDVTTGDFPFVVRYDGTNAACTIEYMSVDTAI